MKVIKVLLLLSLVFVLLACGRSSSDKQGKLPDGAHIEADWGNGWVIFTKEGHRFLFYRYSDGYYKGYCAITTLDAAL